MKTLKIIFILFVAVSIIAPIAYLFLSTFFNSDVVFWVTIIGALGVAFTGVKEDLKENLKKNLN